MSCPISPNSASICCDSAGKDFFQESGIVRQIAVRYPHIVFGEDGPVERRMGNKIDTGDLGETGNQIINPIALGRTGGVQRYVNSNPPGRLKLVA